MTPEERNELRMKLLKDLYDYNFEKGGREAQINIEDTPEGREKVVALQYLNDKNLINSKLFHKSAYQAKITAYGIDVIETGRSLR